MKTYYYNGKEFSEDQYYEICEGYMDGLTDKQIAIYADPRFTFPQMQQIRWGLEVGLDVSKFANPKYSADEMKEIYEQLRMEKYGSGNH